MRSIHRYAQSGFTLVELMVVLLLTAIMAMTAAPNLLTVLIMTEHENEARHLVGFGRAAMAHAVLKREAIVVHVDMNEQEYWVTAQKQSHITHDEYGQPRGVNLSSYGERPMEEAYSSRFSRHDEKEEEWIPKEKADLAQAASEINQYNRKKELGEKVDDIKFSNDEEQERVLEEQQDSMEENFTLMSQNTLFAQAMRIKHEHDGFETWEEREEERLLREKEIQDQMTKKELEVEGQDLSDPLLKRHRVIETVKIQSVIIGDDTYTFQEKKLDKNVIEIELSPLGLDMPVGIELINEEQEVFRVIWNPMTGNAWHVAVDEEDA